MLERQNCTGKTIHIFGVNVDLLHYDEVLKMVEDTISKKEFLSFDTSNTFILSKAARDSDFKKALLAFDKILLDAQPLVWYARLLGGHIRETCYGPELTVRILRRFHKDYRIMIVGSKSEAQEPFKQKFGEVCSWVLVPRFDSGDNQMLESLVDSIKSADPHIVFLALGTPAQHYFMDFLKQKINRGVFIGNGGSIELVAGLRPIAPKIIQRAGLNWLFRLLLEPKRLWRRYLVYNSLFLIYCIRFYSRDLYDSKRLRGAIL